MLFQPFLMTEISLRMAAKSRWRLKSKKALKLRSAGRREESPRPRLKCHARPPFPQRNCSTGERVRSAFRLLSLILPEARITTQFQDPALLRNSPSFRRSSTADAVDIDSAPNLCSFIGRTMATNRPNANYSERPGIAHSTYMIPI